MAQGHADSRNMLFEHNLRLVAHIVKKSLSILFAMGACALVAGIIRARKISLHEALAGLLPLLLLLIVGSAVLFQHISYLFSLAMLGILGVAQLDRYRIGRWMASTVVGTGIVLLYAPVCWLIYVLFMLPFTPVVVAISVIPISIVSAVLVAGPKDAAGNYSEGKQPNING
ncbi:hypothetical protein [Paenibacillus sp. J31TS4]|uniref:hypothetical protein n=1 Tax=Paenibacillus sp. J31TS4 TaxID=2807195 RepID=UPI0020C0FF3F|nr:hypothetical protein [Paenibacillus sp. J31TS4]